MLINELTQSQCDSVTEKLGIMFSFRLAYIFSYNLFQFCGHTWILANSIARLLTFGRDALADTFYSIGFVMSLCQLLSILELFHIADGIEKARLLPRFVQVCITAQWNFINHTNVIKSDKYEIVFFLFFNAYEAVGGLNVLSDLQVMEKNLLLIMVIMVEEIQSKPVVFVLFFLWNILDLLRYTHELLCSMDKPSIAMLWARYTLRIPLYTLSVATEVVTIYQTLPYVEAPPPKSCSLNSTASAHIHRPILLMLCLPVLALGKMGTALRLRDCLAAAEGETTSAREMEQEDEKKMTIGRV
ncbi:Very-long-chain (3R)-3-hydroxyacyl-CoA dehydratase [Collichthys lucidus]|uniref:Very-long-chain (3R)-3-hydroxyacyl-CoA dehydratase n=1 Tax=Collichthys lucidus TaxID=240159 RepID=A0A4U5VVZ8_COLLU|nr:Very-long-chain (3R)-3-hydroxyacyl-CoA dehydratase [Collichthys lucidus]